MLTRRRIALLAAVVVVGILVGRLVARAALNLAMGGTLLGGNSL